MSSPIVQPSTFSTAKVTISQPKSMDSGGKTAYLNYGDKRSLIFQTPSLPSPFGLNIFDKSSPPKYSIDLAMRGYQENPKVKSFYNALSALDEYMIEQGVKNCKLWFKMEDKPKAGQTKEQVDTANRAIITAFYTPCVKFGKDKEGNQTPYPPNLKVQLRRNRDTGEFECQFYDGKAAKDANAQPLKGIPVEEMLVKKVEVTCLIQCTGVWFAGGKFGVSWKAVQMRLDSVPEGIHGYGFQDEGEEFTEPAEFGGSGGRAAIVDDDDEESEEEAVPAPRQATAAPAQPAVEDSDDEEEVAPAPVPKKTVMTKKKVVAATKK